MMDGWIVYVPVYMLPCLEVSAIKVCVCVCACMYVCVVCGVCVCVSALVLISCGMEGLAPSPPGQVYQKIHTSDMEHTHTRTHTHTHIHAHTHSLTSTNTHSHTHSLPRFLIGDPVLVVWSVSVCVCVGVCVCVCVCVCLSVCCRSADDSRTSEVLGLVVLPE